MLIAKLNGQKLTVVSDTVVSDSVKYLTVRFEFSREWDGFLKTAIFFGNDGSSYSVPMIEGNSMYLGENICYVPSEVIKYSDFQFSVFGTKEDSVITSDRVQVQVRESGYAEGETPAEPTPSEYQQIISATDKAVADAADAKQASTESAQKVEVIEEKLTSKMDKFGEVDENGNIKITSGDFKIYQTKDSYIEFDSGSVNFSGQIGPVFKTTPHFEKGLTMDMCNPEDPTSVANVWFVNESLSQKEDVSNKIDTISEDIVINQADGYPSVSAVWDFVNEKVGDIGAALDSIIALQNSYIGGEKL